MKLGVILFLFQLIHSMCILERGRNKGGPKKISEKLATCGKVGFNTYDEVIPSPVDGIITLVKDEYLYKGFLSEADGQIERFDGLKYELIVKSISKA